MGRPRTLKPTAAGGKILAVVLEHYESILAASRAAGVREATLRRRIYGAKPKRIDVETLRRLMSLGIPRHLVS